MQQIKKAVGEERNKMEAQLLKDYLKIVIRQKIIDLRYRGVKTSKGEKMSMAAIGRTLDPPVTHVAVLLVINGETESRRIKDAIEKELDQIYWIKKRAA